MREIIERYSFRGHMELIQQRLDELDALPELSFDLQIERAELDELLTFLVETARQHYSANNDAVIEKSLADEIQSSPMVKENSFPMEYFMDYCEPTPKHNVGDIVWGRIGLTNDNNVISVRCVVVAKTVDLDDIYYSLAPYTAQLQRVWVIPRDFTEDDITIDDPQRECHLKVVK